ncbi:MAG TPA: cytochrome d ubiquinol oxidase subunit II [Streptosporangiaceae bacterium]|nr:cytochrome d ubiquinol oxidase subunit II [Streptosporangiaceae bacterium]
MAFVPFWFVLIAILWTGFFVLEGFDLGVGMLHGLVGRDEDGRRAVINTIGPLWDGNEVWLIVAGAAIFAAFPGWYATWFSALYLALVLLLVALILRGVSFEYRGKDPDRRWRLFWTRALIVTSFLIPLLIGVALGDLLHGLPIAANHEYTGGFWDLLQPYGIMTGVMFVAVCIVHGGTFISMKTTDAVRERAWKVAKRAAPITVLIVIAWVAWTHVVAGGGAFLNPVELIVAIAVIAAAMLIREHNEGWAFAATTLTIATCVITLFVDLYPHVMISSTNPRYSLTVYNSASGPYTLKIMTVVALVLLPFVLGYQAWTYYVFRKRITVHHFRPAAAPQAPPATASAQAAPGRPAAQQEQRRGLLGGRRRRRG